MTGLDVAKLKADMTADAAAIENTLNANRALAQVSRDQRDARIRY